MDTFSSCVVTYFDAKVEQKVAHNFLQAIRYLCFLTPYKKEPDTLEPFFALKKQKE